VGVLRGFNGGARGGAVVARADPWGAESAPGRMALPW
jgi:hypothetical protein